MHFSKPNENNFSPFTGIFFIVPTVAFQTMCHVLKSLITFTEDSDSPFYIVIMLAGYVIKY